MRRASCERWGAAAGVVFVLLVPVLLVIEPGQPEMGAPAVEVHRYQVEKQSQIHAYLTMWFVAILFLTWFLGTVLSILRAGERGARPLSGVAFIGATLGLTAILLTVMFEAAAAFRPEAIGPEVTQAIWDLSYLPLAVLGVGLVVMLLAIGALTFQTALLPTWFGWASLLVGAANALYIGQIAVNDKHFAGEIGFMLFIPWVLVAAVILLIRRVDVAVSDQPEAQPAARAPV